MKRIVVPAHWGNKWLGYSCTNDKDETSIIFWILRVEISFAWLKKEETREQV